MTDPNDTLLKEIFRAIPVHHRLAFLRETLTSLDPELRKKLLQSLPNSAVSQRTPPPKRRTANPSATTTAPSQKAPSSPDAPLESRRQHTTPPATQGQGSSKPYQRPPLQRPEYQPKHTTTTATPTRPSSQERPVPQLTKPRKSAGAVVSSQNELDELEHLPQDQKDAQVQAILKQFEQQKITMHAQDQTNIKKELFLLLVWVFVGLSMLVGLSVGAAKLWEFLFP